MATRRTTSTRGPPSCDRCCELQRVVLPEPLLWLGWATLEDLEPMLELLCHRTSLPQGAILWRRLKLPILSDVHGPFLTDSGQTMHYHVDVDGSSDVPRCDKVEDSLLHTVAEMSSPPWSQKTLVVDPFRKALSGLDAQLRMAL